MRLFILMCLFVTVKDSSACSFYVNDQFQKNLLIAHGASHLDIDLSKVSETNVSAYRKTLDGSTNPTSCPKYLETEAVIRFQYMPDQGEYCEARLTVHRKEFVGEVPTGPIETVYYSEVSAMCGAVTEVTPAIKPIRYYRKLKRPFPF